MDTEKKVAKPKAVRFQTRTGTVEEFISEGCSELVDIGGEFREIVDNTPESLQSTDIYSTREATADALENISEPTAPGALADLTCSTQIDMGKTYRGRQTQSRACRANNAAGMLRAAADAVREWADNNQTASIEEDGDGKWYAKLGDVETPERFDTEQEAVEACEDVLGCSIDEHNEAVDEAETIIQECEDAADEAENAEYPGMFG